MNTDSIIASIFFLPVFFPAVIFFFIYISYSTDKRSDFQSLH